MVYLIIALIVIFIIICMYVFLLIKKCDTQSPVIIVNVISVMLTNILHYFVLVRLFYHCKNCVFGSEKIRGIDFFRFENILGVNMIDANDVKSIMIITISIMSILLLFLVNKRNNKQSHSDKVTTTVIYGVLMLIVNGISLAIKSM